MSRMHIVLVYRSEFSHHNTNDRSTIDEKAQDFVKLIAKIIDETNPSSINIGSGHIFKAVL